MMKRDAKNKVFVREEEPGDFPQWSSESRVLKIFNYFPFFGGKERKVGREAKLVG